MPMSLAQQFSDLRFTKSDLSVFTDDQYKDIAKDFWHRPPPNGLTGRDRAFIMAALLVAVDKSEQAGFVFAMYQSFVGSAPSKSVWKLVKKLATSTIKAKFKKYIDDTPKYSAVGRSAIQYSAFATQWRMRVGLDDDSELDDFRAKGNPKEA